MGVLLSVLFFRYENCVCLRQYHISKGIPMPDVPHKILTQLDIGDKDVLIIGDVHGCLDELQELITQANQITNQNCTFLFCGDIINKGPKNKETLDFVQSLGDQAHVVRGNHENHVLGKLCAGNTRTNDTQLLVEGVSPKYHWIMGLTPEDLHYLNQLPYTISIPHLQIIVVHAGIVPGLPLDRQSAFTMTKMRNICNSDSAENTDVGIPWASVWPGPEHVYFGHDAVRGLQTYPFATGLDTGCLYGKCLTAKFATGRKQYLSVKSKQVYHKPSKG